jgi:hypothetical protein
MPQAAPNLWESYLAVPPAVISRQSTLSRHVTHEEVMVVNEECLG